MVRLLRLADHPEDFAVLAPAAEREIHWRLMNGPHAATVRRIAMPGSWVWQFSREYRRLFGAPPGQDAARLLSAGASPDDT